jgi:phosphate transport system substrate-binding protein
VAARCGSWAWAWVLALGLTACGPTNRAAIEPPKPILLRVAGSTSMQSLLQALTVAYTAQRPYVTFDLLLGGSGLGLDLLKAGQADIAASSWPPTTAELTRAGLQASPVALDGLSIIVHPTNPIEDLSLVQVRGIFRGRISDWREVGGKIGDTLVVSREDGSGSRQGFESLVMDRQPVTPAAVVMPSSQAVVDYVAGHPNAIGYTGMGDLTDTVKAVAIEGLEPIPARVKEGTYPLTRILALIVSDHPSDGARAFVEFAAGPAAQDIVKARWAPVK